MNSIFRACLAERRDFTTVDGSEVQVDVAQREHHCQVFDLK